MSSFVVRFVEGAVAPMYVSGTLGENQLAEDTYLLLYCNVFFHRFTALLLRPYHASFVTMALHCVWR